MLLKLHPEVAGRECSDCVRYQYDDIDRVGGRRLLRRGLPVLRPQGQPTPCRRCPKIPTGVVPLPHNAVEWTAKSWAAYRFHQRCKAVGRFPADAIVERNAEIIETTLEEIRDQWTARGADLLTQLAGLAAVAR